MYISLENRLGWYQVWQQARCSLGSLSSREFPLSHERPNRHSCQRDGISSACSSQITELIRSWSFQSGSSTHETWSSFRAPSWKLAKCSRQNIEPAAPPISSRSIACACVLGVHFSVAWRHRRSGQLDHTLKYAYMARKKPVGLCILNPKLAV
jgi:hypothetical protein